VDSDYLFGNCLQRPLSFKGFPSEHPGVDVIARFAGFLASGQPSAGRELGDPINREVSQSRQGPSKESRESGFLVASAGFDYRDYGWKRQSIVRRERAD
jgi:hypothetical protein